MFDINMKNAFKGMVVVAAVLLLCSFIKLHADYGNRSQLMMVLPFFLWSTPIPSSSPLLSSLAIPPSPSLGHKPENKCKGLTKWVVITTDNRTMTPAVATLLNSTIDWCLLVLGLERPYWTADLSTSNMIYMPREELVSLPYKLVSVITNSPLSRRNVGYIYAIDRGAKVIVDMNENRVPHAIYQMQLYENIQQLHKIPQFIKEDDTDNPIWDPSPQLDNDHVWAKLHGLDGAGGPEIKDTLCKPIIQQNVAAHSINPGLHPKRLAVPRGIISPYSIDDTVHLYEAFWALLLPKTLENHASAIWRAYIAQSLFYLIPDASVMYVYPSINSNIETAVDTESYINAITTINTAAKTKNTVNMLKYLPASFDQFQQALTHVYKTLQNENVIDSDDLEYLNAWVIDLLNIGYTFPQLPTKSKLWTKDVQLCIMFNWGAKEYAIKMLLAYYLRYFRSIALLYDGDWPSGISKYYPEGVMDMKVDTHQGWYQQRALYQCLKLGRKNNLNTLYIPDDIFFNISSLSRMSLSKVWFTGGAYIDFTIQAQVFHDNWWWWWGTSYNYYEMLKRVISSLPRKRMKQYEASGYPKRVTPHAISDIIYVPQIFTSDMLESLQHDMGVEPELFCEVHYPMLIDSTVPESQKVQFLACNLWLEDRKKVSMITECSRTQDFVHPLKLRDKFHRDLWCTFMNEMFKSCI